MLVMATMMVPGEATIISNYLTVGSLGLLDTYIVLILPSLTSAMGIFLFRQFYMTFPVSLYESAKLDGCGNLRFIVKILMPLTKSAMGAMAVLHLYQCMEYVHVAAAGYRFGQQAYRTDWYQYAEQRRCTVDYPDAGGRGNDYHSIHFHLYRRPEGLNQRNVFRSSQGLIPVTEKRIENCMKNEEKK